METNVPFEATSIKYCPRCHIEAGHVNIVEWDGRNLVFLHCFECHKVYEIIWSSQL